LLITRLLVDYQFFQSVDFYVSVLKVAALSAESDRCLLIFHAHEQTRSHTSFSKGFTIHTILSKNMPEENYYVQIQFFIMMMDSCGKKK